MLVYSAGLALLGLVGFGIGYLSQFGVALGKTLPKLPFPSVRGIQWIGYLCVALGIGGYLWLFKLAFVEGQPLAIWRRTSEGLLYGQGHIVFLLPLLGIGTTIYLSGRLMTENSIGIGGVILILLYSIFGWTTGSKSSTLAPFFAFFYLRHYLIGRIPISGFFLLGSLLLGSVIVLGIARLYGFEETLNLLLPQAGRILAANFDGFEQTVRVVEGMSSQHSFLYGLTFFDNLFWSFVPRAAFPSKPEVWGLVRLQEIALPGTFDPSSNKVSFFPPSAIAEGYANFGPTGVVVEMLLIGLLLRALYVALARESFRCGYLVFSAYLGANLFHLMRAGSGIISLLPYAAFIYLAFRIVRGWSYLHYERASPARF